VRVRPSPLPTGSVSQDWRSPLPVEKSVIYLHTLHHLESSYSMFSVNLDEAIGFRRNCHFSKACQVLAVTPALCNRLSSPLQVLLRAMHSHAKHFRTTPNLNPLDPDNFQLSRSRRAASFNDLCSRIFLSQRSQFLHKVSTLLDLVENLDLAFSHAAAEIADPSCLSPEPEWDVLDASHYDLNTCLRESIVLLKCFLHALPKEQLAAFDAALRRQVFAPANRAYAPHPHLAHRRISLLKGQ
jgi:hypothetical protein